MKTSFSFFYTILTHQNNFLRHALRRISATQLRRNRLLLPQNTQIVSFRIFLCKNALILWNIKTNIKQKKVFSERLNREKIWEKKGIGAKGGTRTLTPCGTNTWSLRVYQFRHFRNINFLMWSRWESNSWPPASETDTLSTWATGSSWTIRICRSL